MLEVRGLHASINGTEILKGVDLTVSAGETHAIMGPNGSGKSTLAYVLAGRPGYEVTQGNVIFDGKDLMAMSIEDRARLGIFLSFQNPIEIPGVRLDHFLRAGYNEITKASGGEELDVLKFDRLIKEKVSVVDMDYAMTKRSVNEGFSGGERKRSEILQMTILEPRLALLDEIDSGLDIDALRDVAEAVNSCRSSDRALVIVTHYQRLLDYIIPDKVHVLVDGRFVAEGGKELALDIEAKGYDWLIEGVEASS